MRLLLDTCVWGGARKELQAQGHDVIWAGEWPEDPGDDEILICTLVLCPITAYSQEEWAFCFGQSHLDAG